MAKPIIPANPYIQQFDFRQIFDLVEGKLKINLLTEYINNAAGITGVKLEVVTPTKTTISPRGFIFAPANFFTVYDVTLPRAAGSFIYGTYIVRLTLVLNGKEYPNEKSFNLCPIDNDSPLRLEGQGKMELRVDCANRMIRVGGFSGYAYNGKSPASEEKTVTVYYPSESEIKPQKNISQLPFETEARNGTYVIKGANVATYKFDDETFVKVKWVASVEKKVRCGIPLAGIYNAVQDVFVLGKGTAGVDLCDLWCKVGPLLSLIQLGTADARDISEIVDKLETILKVECGCSDLGDLVSEPPPIAVCPQVKDATAVVNNFAMLLTWSSQGIRPGSLIQIEYRPKATGENGSWTMLNPSIPANGGNQQLSLQLMITGQYEVRFTVISGTNTCPPVTINSNIPMSADCVEIRDVVGVSYPGEAPPSGGTTVPPATTTIAGTDIVYVGAKAEKVLPTGAEVLSTGTPSQQNSLNDILADWRPFNADYMYPWVFWPNKGATSLKNQWVENPQDNFGSIGGPENFLGDVIPVLINGQAYYGLIGNIATKFLNSQNPVSLKNV